MRLVESRHFPGINVHCFKPALEVVINLEEMAGRETSEFPDFTPALLKLLPGLKEHVCGIGRQGGFVLRLQKGTYFGHVVEHTAIELLNMAGYHSSYGKTRVIDGGLYRIVIQCRWPKTALMAMEMAVSTISQLLKGMDFNLDIGKLEAQLAREKPGPSTQAIIDAATSRGIPVSLLGHGSLLRLGTGVYRQYIEATITERTSCIGVDIASDKTMTKSILASALIPTPFGKVARDEDDAVAIAKEIGKLAVVKPVDGNQGKGVSLNLASEAQVRSAYKAAENFGSKILVEEQICGRHYRLLVVNNKVVAASERFPARVVGDGINTIKDLIEIENRKPLRGEEHEKPLTKIKVDQIVFNVLARQNLTMNYIPGIGETVDLRDNANLSTGGTAEDVTPWVHDDNKELACRIARLLGLDVAGIDIVTEDISLPLQEGNGAVIEVNAAPGIRMHLFPSQGMRRQAGDAIVDYLFPWGRPHSIPLISVTGTNGKTTVARLIAHVLARQGQTTGLACTDGIYIDGLCLNAGDNTGPVSAEAILSDPAVEVAVLETARGGLVRRGLGYIESNVAVVTNIANDHLGCDGINTIEELCHVKSLVVETVSQDGFAVLNAEDERVIAMAEGCPGKVIYFSSCPENKTLSRHLAAGGRGVMLMDDKIYLVVGNKSLALTDVTSLPITFAGAARHNVANCLAAAGALWALEVDPEEIASGLKEFNWKDNPGRGNHYDFGTFQVLLDYGHNFAGIKSMLEFIEALHPARKVGIIGMPGDRSDEDVIQAGGLCGKSFDVIYIKEDKDLRGRAPGEVAALLAQGINSVHSKATVEKILDEVKALEAAVKNHQQGDLIIIFYESFKPLQQYLNALCSQ